MCVKSMLASTFLAQDFEYSLTHWTGFGLRVKDLRGSRPTHRVLSLQLTTHLLLSQVLALTLHYCRHTVATLHCQHYSRTGHKPYKPSQTVQTSTVTLSTLHCCRHVNELVILVMTAVVVELESRFAALLADSDRPSAIRVDCCVITIERM
jgi:hypothetical protein